MFSLRLGGVRGARRRGAVVVCIVSALFASTVVAEAGAAADLGSSARSTQGDAVSPAKAKKKKCKKGYKRVTIKVKRKRHGKTVTVKVKKCRKDKKAKKKTTPAPAPPSPTPTPTPANPRIDQILGWSTLAQNPDTPPADLVADGGTITTCTTTNSLSVYIRRSGFTSIGLVTHTWKRNGVVIASSSNSSTAQGAFRYGITISPINALYEITWSYGGNPIGTAKITRSC